MAARKFKFVSPGVFLREVDNSQLPKLPGNVGPVIIGRTRKGPAMQPVKVDSYADFVEVFGEPIPGNQGDDPWREGNGLLATAYANYAAKAYFGAEISSPVTMVRLLGIEGDNAESPGGAAGWTANAAYALVTYASGTVGNSEHNVSAVFYVTSSDTHVRLLGQTPKLEDNAGGVNYISSGSLNGSCGAPLGSVVKTSDSSAFKIMISSSLGTSGPIVHEVDFDRGSKNYIRSVLNTNPTMVNNNISYASSGTLAQHYWLGETFEEHIPTGSVKYGYMVRLQGSTLDYEDYSHQASAGRTGWVICQHEGVTGSFEILHQDKLFRLISVSEGEEISRNTIVAIEDIRIAEDGATDPYGTFTVTVKRVFGTRLEVVESFPGCNLNPNSQNYVARQIGDQYFQWSATEKRNKVYGSYVNNSRYIRVDMDSNVDQGSLSPSKIPFGFYGPVIPKAIAKTSDSGKVSNIGADGETFLNNTQAHSSSLDTDHGQVFTINWPALKTTFSASIDGSDYFGAAIYKRSGDNLSSEIDRGMIDYIRKAPTGLTAPQTKGVPDGNTKYGFAFSLDDVVIRGTNLLDTSLASVTDVYHLSGSRLGAITDKPDPGDASFTALSGGAGISAMLELGFDKFHMPLVGGCDGVNITEADPFNNSTRTLSGKTTRNSYAYASVDRAIELIRDPEVVEHNLAVMPGITNTALTLKLVQKCESRADSLAIIDLPDVYKPPHEAKCETFADRIGTNPDKAAKALKQRQINSSYGASYYPWVKIRDDENTREVWVPPSVVALGVMAYTEQRDEVWFAPAGFNRGGLNEGNAGIPVLQVSEQLMSKQRDALYESNINPIASFVTEGLVIFGQKTLQSTPSALDRINVRRLLIFVKKEISRIANGLLFDQNVPATWNRFLGQVNPFLQSVKTRLGLSDFKVILDNTTTTPDLVDRNVMYAKIFLKPARAIEFIAVDFVITNTGASFDD